MIEPNKYIDFRIPEGSCVGVLTANASYIPIHQFKSTLEKVVSVVSEKNLNAMIFDKRKLDTFHQPSMEWYYIEWKNELVTKGLTRHYKILPENEWFQKSVEAGKNEIYKKYPEYNFSSFSVAYVKNIDEALQKEAAISS